MAANQATAAVRARAVSGWHMPSPARLRAVKVVLFLVSLLPLARLVTAGVADAQGLDWSGALTLGTNPIELITRSTGTWTLVFLCITLAVTPLRRLTGWNWLVRLRRMIGLFAFFYATLHFLTYFWFDQWFDFRAIVADVIKRPFITVGFLAFVLLLPLAATSTDGMIRRLGRRWSTLHMAIYPIATLGVLHYWWLVKRDVTQPAIYAGILALLLGFRLAWRARTRAQGAPHPSR